jgi:transcriptional regulator with XRE-family HTH domain
LTLFLAGVGRQIAHLRVQARLTQAEAAAGAGIDVRQWGRLEAGSSNPTVQTLFAIAKVLDVEVSEVVTPRRVAVANPRRRGRPRLRAE